VGVLVLSAVFLLTIVLAAVVARAILGVVLHVVTTGALPTAHALRTATFLGAAFAFWSLARAVAASPAVTGLITRVR
jgi:hypothetical protein